MKTLLLIAIFLPVIGISQSFANGTPNKIICGGSEPSWDLKIENESVSYYVPRSAESDDEQVFTIKSTKGALGSADGSALQITGASIDSKKIKLSINKEVGCNDGMREETYDINVIVEVDGKLLKGCCK